MRWSDWILTGGLFVAYQWGRWLRFEAMRRPEYRHGRAFCFACKQMLHSADVLPPEAKRPQ